MARHSIDDPGYWRDRAEESRAMAEQMPEPEAKAALLKIADSYEYLAQSAASRAKRTRAE